MVFLSLLWHMHQPYYVSLDNREMNSPIIIFRTLFNYYPMALLASMYPSLKINFNITPVLIKQIEGIASGEIHDNFLEMLAKDDVKQEELNLFLEQLPDFLFKKYRVINLLAEKLKGNTFSSRDLFDLKIYMHLVSFNPLLVDQQIESLFKKGRGFNIEDQECLYKKEKEILSKVMPLYRELQDKKQIEISTSPFAHPILPLIFNTDNARKTATSLSVPEGLFSFPSDAKMQLLEGMNVYRHTFGTLPKGIWPSEGSLSNEVLELFAETGILWTATDEYVLYQTLTHSLSRGHYNIWDFNDKVSLFFRDHTLSDVIGFSYQNMAEKASASDFIRRLENIRTTENQSLVTVILDGENPWDFYPEQGVSFLTSLYHLLTDNNQIKTTTFSEALQENILRKKLNSISPGSWMGNNFDNWIGREPANKAWRILRQARETSEKIFATLPEQQQKMLQEAIMIAESSDWFWWYSLPADPKIKRRFDFYFRRCIRRMYEISSVTLPEYLCLPIEEYGYEETFPYITPVIDGKNTHFYEWYNAIEIDPSHLWGTFMPVNFPIKKVFYGYDAENIFIRLDIKEENSIDIYLTFHDSTERSFRINQDITAEESSLVFAKNEIMEIQVPRKLFPSDEKIVFFTITIETSDGRQFKIPRFDYFKLIFKEKENWIV